MIEDDGLATAMSATGICIEPDRTRVVTQFFVPGCENVGAGDSRAATVIQRVLTLDEDEVERALGRLDRQFVHRGLDDLHAALEQHAVQVMSRLATETKLSRARRLVLGAAFTQEYALEGAALCNPSAVLHPDQTDADGTRFILSFRCIGEGHLSSIGFRSGTITAAGAVSIDAAGNAPKVGRAFTGRQHSRALFHAQLSEVDDDHENAAFVLDSLPLHFDDDALEGRIAALVADRTTRRNTARTAAHLRRIAQSSYRVEFPNSVELADRVLWPHAIAERHGMEDARFVRFVERSGSCRYYATYTAFDGTNVSQQLLETTDFLSFSAAPMAGAAASGKGLAIFPRLINGRYAALSRADRETNAIAFSDDLHCWTRAESLQSPERAWEVVQVGNCGSPIETEAGWLVFTHAVGPMRTYTIGALLLALDEPQRVLASTPGPIIGPGSRRRDAYVPNVVYSCGAFEHNGTIVVPYGVGDQRIEIATTTIDALLQTMGVR